MKLAFVQNSGINESLVLTEISAFLRSEGHICDLFLEKNERNFFEVIDAFSPDIFVIPWDIAMSWWVLRMYKKIRDRYNKPAVFCGSYPTFYPDAAINYHDVEIICIGEAEYALLELVDRFVKGEDFHNIMNLWVKKKGVIFKNKVRPIIRDLDSLPLPDRNLYFKYRCLSKFGVKRFISGRGCYNNCSFCYNPLFRERYVDKGTFVRKKSVKRIIEEIETVKHSSSVKFVHFSDDTFSCNRNWIFEFSREYTKKIKIPFSCNLSIETIDKELVVALKNCGCRAVAIGIETGSDDLRRSVMNKWVTNSEILHAARLLRYHNISILTFNMLAFPGETINDAFKTLEINAKIKPNCTELKYFVPLLGTRLADTALEKGNFDKQIAMRLLNEELYPLRPIVRVKNSYQFENLFYLFPLGTRLPFMIPLIKKIVKLRLTYLFWILSFINIAIFHFQLKRFFNVSWIQGFKYFLSTNNIKKRTNVFNVYLP
jgi:radical SAM superfamily enzyme YgiQ (UPF0313 family)